MKSRAELKGPEEGAPIYTLETQADEPCSPINDLLHRTLENGGFTIGDICFDPGTRRRTFSIGYPVRDRVTQTEALVFATLNWDHPSGAEIRAQLPKGASWTELDSDGKTLAQFGESQPAVWPPSVQSSLINRFFNALYTVGEAMDSGSVRTVYASAFRHSAVAQRPLVGVITIPRDRLFAEADRLLERNLIGLGIATVVALGLAWFGCQRLIFRPLQTLAEAMTRLAAGDFWFRAALLRGRDELGWLTAAFLQMAQSLEQRERDRKNVSHKVKSLSQKLVQIQESERRHIARELHDEIGQSLTVAEMNLQAALRSARQPGLARRLRESAHAVERVLDQVQDLSLNLRPSMLDDLGLEPALRWYVDRQASSAGLRADWVIDPIENRLEWLIETECFRIAQEALTNIIRHAKARAIVLELTREDGHLHLRVRDDGIGFHVTPVRQAAQRGESLGVLSMEERALLAGGGLQLESAPGRGTCVHAWFPLRWRTEPTAD
jgi:signal transduction histidine kinase